MRKALLLLLIITSTLLYGAGIEDAKEYLSNPYLLKSTTIPYIHSITWNGNERVLDVGCGDGPFTAYIADNCTANSVIGIDLSESMIEYALIHYPQLQHKNLIFLCADAAELPFDQQFDIAVSFSALHWVLDQESALTSIYRSLVSGGTAYLLTHAQHRTNVHKLSEQLIATEKWSSHFPNFKPQRVYFTKKQYLDLMNKAGFTKVQVRQEKNRAFFQDRISLSRMVAPQLTFTKHLSPELRQMFLDDVIDQIISKATTFNDSIILEFYLLYVSGTKP